MKKVSFVLILVLVLTLCAACAAAPTEAEETIFYEDGSYLVITTVASGRMTTEVIEGDAQVMPQSHYSIVRDGKRIWVETNANGLPRYRSEIATKYCSYYSADNRLLWTMSLMGIFRENIIDRHCDVVRTNVTIHEQDSWYVIDESEDKDIDNVFYTVRFGRKNLGVTIAEPSYTISLSRGEKGEFH